MCGCVCVGGGGAPQPEGRPLYTIGAVRVVRGCRRLDGTGTRRVEPFTRWATSRRTAPGKAQANLARLWML